MKILVTGASRGIGRAIFDELKQDNSVYITARNKQLLADANADGYSVCDISSSCDELCEYVKNIQFDCIINNAGEYVYGAIDTMTEEQILHIYKTNLIAPVKIISAAVPYMKEQKFGRIVNIGSISGVMGEAYASLYSSTKSGLIGLTKALALELAEYNITVNTINPGWVDTDLGMSSIDDSEFTKEEIVECIPQRRFVEPIEVAKLVRYLISKEAKGLTGQSINLCAGLSVGI